MTYEEFKIKIHDEHLRDYWEQIYRFADEILEDVAVNRQVRVSQELGIPQAKLSSILPLLRVIRNINRTRT